MRPAHDAVIRATTQPGRLAVGPAPPFAHQRQPRRSHVCGQVCVAIVARVSPAAAIAVCGKDKRSTSEHDLRRGLQALGLELAPFVRVNPTRRRLPDLVQTTLATAPAALVRVRFTWRRHGYHWVVFTRHHVYDPSLPRVVSRFTWLRLVLPRQGYVTSCAAVRAVGSTHSVNRPHSDRELPAQS